MRYDFVHLGVVIGIILFTILVAFLFQRVFERVFIRNVILLNKDKTSFKFLKHFITALIYIVGFAWAGSRIEELRTLAGSILAGAGILAIVVGLASQAALSNVISGIFLVMFKPYKIRDRIHIRDGVAGTVEDITLRHTMIRDWENRRIIIPNSIISNEVIVNSDIEDSRICRHIQIGISYDADIDLAKSILRDHVLNHPGHIDGRTKEQVDQGVDEVPVRVIELGEYYVLLRAWAWTPDFETSVQMRWDVLESVKKQYDKDGIEIPFPYRTIVEKKDIVAEKRDPNKENG